MKVESLNLYSFNQSITISLPGVGAVCLIEALSEAEQADIFNICMLAAQRKLNLTVLADAIKPDIKQLENIEYGDFSETR